LSPNDPVILFVAERWDRNPYLPLHSLNVQQRIIRSWFPPDPDRWSQQSAAWKLVIEPPWIARPRKEAGPVCALLRTPAILLRRKRKVIDAKELRFALPHAGKTKERAWSVAT
jgi:hypothetical protein